MNPATAFPHKYYLNLDRRPDRRARCEELFAQFGWDVARHSAVDAFTVKNIRGFASAGRYAHAVGTRLILRRAMLAGAEAVLILEDDVVLHPALEERLAEMELPADWGLFYLGCQHCERPEVVAPGLVRVRGALDTHAWAVRREYFLEVRQALRGKFWPADGTVPNADILLAELARRIPVYAAYPNLAWQEECESDLTGEVYANYLPDGQQVPNRHCLRGLLAEALGGKTHAPAAAAAQQTPAWFWPAGIELPPRPLPLSDTPASPLREGERVAFLFLTKSAHLHADMWAEYWQGHEDHVSIYGHAKDRSWTSSPDTRDWLRAAQIATHLPTEWADVSIVRAQMALLKAALAEPQNRFFIFASETCVPVRPCRDLLRMLRLDGRCRMQVVPYELMEELAPAKAGRAPLEGPIPPGVWQFHSQWMLLNREAAELLAANEALVECFAGTQAPDEAAFGTILHAAGWPLMEKTVLQSITWTRWPSDDAPHPELFAVTTPELAGEIIGSGCFFARKFAAGSIVEQYRLHV